MSLLPPSLSLTVDTKRRACVLDTRLALSTYGLLLAQRLASEFDLWLVRELWQILDNTEFYLSEPESLKPPRLGDGRNGSRAVAGTDGMRHVLTQWEWARTETDLAGLKVFWIGDALSESLLPARVDQHLVYRYETLARALERRTDDEGQEHRRGDILADCFRDAAALNVALTPYRSFILTHVLPKDDGSKLAEPALCAFLREKGIRTFRVSKGPEAEIERDFIRPLLARSGVSELMWAGLNLAALHLLAPRAVVIPLPDHEDATFPEQLPAVRGGEPDQPDWWDGALAFWYTLGYE